MEQPQEVVGLGDDEWRFAGWSAFIRWIEKMRDGYSWVAEATGSDPANLRAHIPQTTERALAAAIAARSAKHELSDLHQIVDQYLRPAHAPFHPDGIKGRQIADIREVAGDEAALFAAGMLQGVLSIGNIGNNAHWRGASLALNPEVLAVSTKIEKLEKERRNYRQATRQIVEEFEAHESATSAAWEERLQSAGANAAEWSRDLSRRWLRYTVRARRRQQVALDKIHATNAAFTEKMALKAPVEYWQQKAKKHGDAEGRMRFWLLVYFPLAFTLIILMFGGTGAYLLTTPKTSLPPGLFVVASAGLASAAGMLFWVGRLLTKLYLSQNHMRQDAEERATMTTTYLALTEVAAAAEVDRQIILSALFRSSPDGIVKEEGGLDPSIAAALGKFLASPSR